MRINKFLAHATGMSRRAADAAISEGRVAVNNMPVTPGMSIDEKDQVTLDNRAITPNVKNLTIAFHKPVGYVCSRAGQGSHTIYDLLPAEYHHLKPVGRLDKDSSGLLLLTNDGELAHRLTHPSYQKLKVYEVTLDKPLEPLHRQMISDHGIALDDGSSAFELSRLTDNDDTGWQVRMKEGRNRQIRRTFAALGYEVQRLHRTNFGEYQLGQLSPGEFLELDTPAES